MACVAYGCNSHSSKKTEKNQRVSFHRFPANSVMKRLWVESLRRNDWELTKYSRLCSNHFELECYIQGYRKKKLRTDAVPTKFESYCVNFQSAHSNKMRGERYDIQRDIEISEPSTSTASQPQNQDTPRKSKLKKDLAKEKMVSARCRLKLKKIQQKCRRMKKKMSL